MQLSPYLYFDGRCKEAFTFYAELLGGTIQMMMPHTGTPAEEQMPAEWGDKILHARMTIGDQVIMASDAPPGHYHTPQGYSISITVATVAEAERVYNALAEGGSVFMPLAQTFFADSFAMLNDRFGTPWMVNCDKTPA